MKSTASSDHRRERNLKGKENRRKEEREKGGGKETQAARLLSLTVCTHAAAVIEGGRREEKGGKKKGGKSPSLPPTPSAWGKKFKGQKEGEREKRKRSQPCHLRFFSISPVGLKKRGGRFRRSREGVRRRAKGKRGGKKGGEKGCRPVA